MDNYKNISGKSNIASFQSGDDFIIVKFMTKNKDGCDTYKYTYQSAGSTSVEHMKKLAEQGLGLNSFINKMVRKQYDSKW